jgi:DNA-binding beta-propeller fold protein YncE
MAPSNSSPAAEIGTDTGGVAAGPAPYGIAYVQPGRDTPSFDLVTNSGAASVSVLSDDVSLHFLPNVSVGSEPMGVAWDSDQASDGANGYVYVANHGSDNVSVLEYEVLQLKSGQFVSQFYVATSLRAGVDPWGVAFDPGTEQIYVANENPTGANGTVTVIQGDTTFLPTVVGTMTVGACPRALAYDPLHGNLYVTLYNSSNVEVVHPHSGLKDTYIGVGLDPIAVVYDPENGYAYVASQGSDSVSVFDNTSLVGSMTLTGPPAGLGFDPLNGYVYVTYATYSWDDLGVIAGTRLIGNVTIGSNARGMPPEGVSLDRSTNLLLVADGWTHWVSFLSTALAETSATMMRVVDNSSLPGFHPSYSTDLGVAFALATQLDAVGEGNDSATVWVSPSEGLNCSAPPLVWVDTVSDSGTVNEPQCTPTQPGNYTVWLNVTDRAGGRVWARTPIRVYNDPAASEVEVFHGADGPLPSVDVNESVELYDVPAAGTGNYTAFEWSSDLNGSCSFNLGTATCGFDRPGPVVITVSVEDSNSVWATSPTLDLDVYGLPSVGLPSANRSVADVGQPVLFSESATGGPGAYTSYLWRMTPSGRCTDATNASPTCTFDTAGTVSVTVAVVDDSDVTTLRSAPILVTIDTLPAVTKLLATRLSADVGQPVGFTAAASGGSGSYGFDWAGLPPDCQDLHNASLTCSPVSTGTLSITAVAVDSNGGRSAPAKPLTVTVSPALVVPAPSLSSGNIQEGQSVSVSVSVSGGSGGLSYDWRGLPAGCNATGPSMTCNPSQAGTFSISVRVADSNGVVATSAPAELTVVPATILGLSPLELAGGAGAALVVVGVAVFVVLRRRRPPAG